jgi:protease IV
MKKSRIYWIIGISLFFFSCLGGSFLLFIAILMSPSMDWTETWGGDIAIVEVKGPIFESDAVNEKLEKYRKSSSIKAVVLRIDSPGGAVGPSQEIHNEVKKLAEKKKVVVSMGAVAASGGYYIAAPATKIVANPGTITGSIGVLMEHVEVDELLKWAKVSAEILKAGESKDVGSALRKMTPEERQLLEGLLKNMHAQFRQAVAEGRKLPLEEVEKIGDGRVYTGEQALQLKLVDQLGNLEDAIEVAKNLAGIKGEPRIIRPEKPRPLLLDLLFGDGSEERILQRVFSHSLGFGAFYLLSI